MAFTTGQLKYGAAYWIRVTGLKTAPALGRVLARFETPGKLVANTSNVAELELLPGRFPPGVPQSGALEVNVNGVSHAVNLKGNEPVKLRIEPTAEDDGGSKNAVTEGPVSHAFAESFLLVHATDGGLEEQTLSWSRLVSAGGIGRDAVSLGPGLLNRSPAILTSRESTMKRLFLCAALILKARSACCV